MADDMPVRAPQRDRLDPKTVTRWASAGRIGSIRTPGGHRRFRESEVRALLRGEAADVAVPAQQTVANTVDLNARRMAR